MAMAANCSRSDGASSSGSGSGGGSARRSITSIIEDHGVNCSECGYCKSRTNSSVVHGISARRLHVEDYQELLDRGWRRCGTQLYIPDTRTCCPHYTIRLQADAFVPSKEQIRVRHRMNRYLEGEYNGPRRQSNVSQENTKGMETEEEIEEVALPLIQKLKAAIRDWVRDAGILSDIQFPDFGVKRLSEKLQKQLEDAAQGAAAIYTSNAAFVVASVVKKMHREDGEKVAADVVPADIASQLASTLSDQQNGVIVKACKGHINFFLSALNGVGEVQGEKKGREKHAVSDEAPAHKEKRTLEITMRRSAFDGEEFDLYKKYQVAVHNDAPQRITEYSYRRFLVDTPLVPYQSASTSYGSFHQQYRIDGRLVAVGVVDILPKCLSSKYLFWDPDFAFLSLGKFSALQEIEWVKAAADPSLKYYYLGYYIHSCPKMRYKAAYAPSELLCLSTLQWTPFEIALPLVESGTFVSSANHVDANGTVMEKLGEVPILLYSNGRLVLLKDLEGAAPSRLIDGLKWQLLQYWKLVGNGLASRMAYTFQSRCS